MNDRIQNKRLATRETVLSKDTPSIQTLANLLFKYSVAINNSNTTVLATKVNSDTATIHYNALLKEIHKHQVEIKQAKRIYDLCQKEQERYKRLTLTIKDDMNKTKTEIENLKKELIQARARREGKLQMEAKCKEINQFTTRKELEKSIHIHFVVLV